MVSLLQLRPPESQRDSPPAGTSGRHLRQAEAALALHMALRTVPLENGLSDFLTNTQKLLIWLFIHEH